MCERAAFSSPPHFNQILNGKMIKTETNISAVVNGKRKLVNMIQGEGGNNIVGDILDANAVDEKIDAAVSGDQQISQNYVAVNKQQSFTDAQKRTARENIGASPLTDFQIIMSQLADLRTKDNFITKNLGYTGILMRTGEAKALEAETSGDASVAWVIFTYGYENSPITAMIHQKHGETTTVQTIFYENKVSNRTITFTDNTRTSIESTTAWGIVTSLFGVQATQNNVILRLMNSHLDGSQGLYMLTLPALTSTTSGVITPSQYASLVNGGDYDSSSKTIRLKHGNTVLASIDATAFIKDGMVSNVTISQGYLVISFNTDAGKEDIRISLTDIFNPNNYYTKNDIDSLFVQSSTIRTIVTLTQAEFDALQNKDANTEYNIIES